VADVVATGRGPRPDGLTEDYLTVQCEPAAGAHLERFAARLVLDGGRMRAVPIASA
jgi:hypothetical protein